MAAKSARKTDDFPKRLLSPDGTRAGDDRVPTHRMLRAALILWVMGFREIVRGPNT